MQLSSVRRTRFLAGLLAGVTVTWVGYVAFSLWIIPFLPAAFSDLLFAIVPGPLQARAIALLGAGAKLWAFYLFIVAQILSFGWIGLRLTQAPAMPGSQTRRHFQSWLKTAIVVFGLLLVLSLTGTSIGWSWGMLIIVAIGTATLYVALLEFFSFLLRASLKISSSIMLSAETTRYSRRELLAALASTVGTVLLWPRLARDLAEPGSSLGNDSMKSVSPMIPSPPSRFDEVPGLPPRVTPTEQFYYVSKNLWPHQASAWGPLRIEGLVEHPLELSLRELQILPATEEYVTLVCVDYEPNDPSTNDLISTALWKGVSLQTLLTQAGIRPEAATLELYATDGYSTAIPARLARENPATLLAYRMNGRPLDARHGFPVRLISPGLYGFKNIKHLHRIVVSKGEYSGYWERRGWAQQAPVKLLSKITAPATGGRLERGVPSWVAGVAFAGVDGISAVEVSDGHSWEPAELEGALSPYSWTRWAHRWVPSQTGHIVLRVRARDGRGRLQVDLETSSFPAGATGYHAVTVYVA